MSKQGRALVSTRNNIECCSNQKIHSNKTQNNSCYTTKATLSNGHYISRFEDNIYNKNSSKSHLKANSKDRFKKTNNLKSKSVFERLYPTPSVSHNYRHDNKFKQGSLATQQILLRENSDHNQLFISKKVKTKGKLKKSKLTKYLNKINENTIKTKDIEKASKIKLQEPNNSITRNDLKKKTKLEARRKLDNDKHFQRMEKGRSNSNNYQKSMKGNRHKSNLPKVRNKMLKSYENDNKENKVINKLCESVLKISKPIPLKIKLIQIDLSNNQKSEDISPSINKNQQPYSNSIPPKAPSRLPSNLQSSSMPFTNPSQSTTQPLITLPIKTPINSLTSSTETVESSNSQRSIDSKPPLPPKPRTPVPKDQNKDVKKELPVNSSLHKSSLKSTNSDNLSQDCIQQEKVEEEEISVTKTTCNKPVGLSNIGSTCYMNSGLQCLLASPLVSSTLVSDIKNKGSIDGDIALSFKRIIESRERGKVTSDELRSLKRNVATQNDRFIGNNQEDVVEFISTLIDGIDNELKIDRTELNVEGKDITITMLLCKELILIRGQPPRQGGSPRATLDRGEFT